MKSQIGTLTALAVLIGCCQSWAQAITPLSAQHSDNGIISFRTIHTDGEVIQVGVTEPIEGEFQEMAYTVRIPVTNEEGAVTFRDEIRTRTIQKTRQILKAVDETYSFYKLNGDKLTNDDVILKMPMQGGIRVAVLYDGQEIPEAWKELLKEDLVIMKTKALVQLGVPLRMPAPRPRRR